MVQNIVERVARALEKVALEGDNLLTRDPHILTIELARAAILEAIQAMREPSEGMKVAGGLKCEAIMFENEGSGVIFNDMGLVFTAMIDAQIKEMEKAG